MSSVGGGANRGLVDVFVFVVTERFGGIGQAGSGCGGLPGINGNQKVPERN